ncbi:hypothetical protein L1987_13301 [Smallanthus sonchifolius]|uniref:Uncharacterized protein n=1 Tax=Smallanthus sonchifolius TaxID=185202 RepID=A0ACB9JHP6_9ASTR|nr:hypothetical protein L1987_13301 [Smallanthus sonchifolius]
MFTNKQRFVQQNQGASRSGQSPGSSRLELMLKAYIIKNDERMSRVKADLNQSKETLRELTEKVNLLAQLLSEKPSGRFFSNCKAQVKAVTTISGKTTQDPIIERMIHEEGVGTTYGD